MSFDIVKRCAFLGMIAIALAAVTPALTLGGGGGPMPGSECPTDIRLWYDPPPFIGWVTGECDELCDVRLTSGRLDQVGKDCFINFGDVVGGFHVAEGVNCAALKNANLMGFCTTTTLGLIQCGDPPVGQPGRWLEIVGVSGLKWNEDGDEFTAHFVGMLLE